MGNQFSCPCPKRQGLGTRPLPTPAKKADEPKPDVPAAGPLTGEKKCRYQTLEADESNKDDHLFYRILFWAKPEKMLWVGAYTTLCLNSVLGATQPQIYTDVITSVANPTSHAFIVAVGKLTGLSLVLTAMGAGQSVLFAEASFRLNIRLKKMVLGNMLQQDTGFFDSTPAGDLITQVGSTYNVTQVVSSMIPTVFSGSLTLATSFYFLSLMDVRLALITFISVPFELMLSYKCARLFEKYNEEVQECNAKTGTVIQETMYGIKAIRPLHAEDQQSGKFMNLIKELRRLQLRQRRMLANQSILTTVVPHVTGLIILIYGAQLASVGSIPVASVMTITMYQSTLQESMGSLMGLYIDWRSMLGSTRKVIKYLDRLPQGKERGSYVPQNGLKGQIEIKNVSFSYANNPRRKILNDVSLCITAGQSLAIVGSSGGGKSTLINLMMGMYDPECGEVLLDGVPVSEYDPEYLYTRGVAAVVQNPVLFNCSVRENITFGLPDGSYTEESVVAAAKAANAHEFIMRLPKQYDTDMGQDGGKLSGGQRQRLAIARAIVRNPAILLLDEPTSALDNRCEHEVKEALKSVMKDRTVIVVAHRLTTIQHFQRIVVMDKGKFEEDGTHQELLAKGGLYFDLAAGIFAEDTKNRQLAQVRGKTFETNEPGLDM